MTRAARFALAVFLLWSSGVALAADPFPRPAGLRPQIDFWKRIFAEVSENEALIHDDVHLDKVYAKVELPPIPENGLGESEVRKARREKVEREIAKIRVSLETLHRLGPKHPSLGEREREIAKMLEDVSEPRKYREAGARLRTQTGLRERFRRGIEISRRYLPHLEKVFREHGLPTELTRLPLVESTFNVKAYSKVGAAGIWQFMPSSARIYDLAIDEAVDERRDPLLAAVGAARHLRDDYARLGKWPLAVTAYNHGRAGVARAVRTVGSDDIVTIVRRYRGRAFGFASRNFYAEFVAALEVDRDREKYFPGLRYEPVLEFDEERIDDYVPFRSLVRLCGCRADELQELNLSLLSEVVDGKLHVPAGTRLRIPAGRSKAFRAAYATLGSNERFASQREYWIRHRVAQGQSVGAIARRYGSSVRAIQNANGLSSPHRIRVGQVLKIPSGGRSVRVASTSRRSTAKAGTHRIERGETVGEIAQRYDTSVAAIQAANDIDDLRSVRAGTVLEIPGAGGSGSPSRTSGETKRVASSGTHRIERGETVGEIARRYGTSVAAIQTANDIDDLRSVRAGRVLEIPGAEGTVRNVSHRIGPGETVGEIARRYGTSVAAIQTANGIDDLRRVRAGRVLKIPAGSSGGGATRYVSHRVEQGQTVGAIARRYGTTIRAIQAHNGIGNVHEIRAGQVLKIPSS